MKSAQRHICLILAFVFFFFHFEAVYGEEAIIWEMVYPYCESELGYTRDDLTPYNLVHNQDGGWSFSFYVKNAAPLTNGLVIGSIDEGGKLSQIEGPSPVSTFEWLNWEVGKCLLNYKDIYQLKQQWEPKLDSIPDKELDLFIRMRDLNPILDFLRHDIILPDDQCISYEDAVQKSISNIEKINGWKPEMTDHIGIIAEVVHIPSGMDHPVYQFIYTLRSIAVFARNNLYEEEYTDELDRKITRMEAEEDAVFGGSKNCPYVISIQIDAYSGEQVGEIYIETPPCSNYGYTAIILWK